MKAFFFVLAGLLSLPAGAGNYIRTDDDLTQFMRETNLIDPVMEMMIRRTTRSDDTLLLRRYFIEKGALVHSNVSTEEPLSFDNEGESQSLKLNQSVIEKKVNGSVLYKSQPGSTELKLFYWHLSDDDSDTKESINDQFDILVDNFSKLDEVRKENPDLFVFSGVSYVEYLNQIRDFCLSVLAFSMSGEETQQACNLSNTGNDYLNAQTEHVLFGSNFLAISPLPLEPYINQFDDVGLTFWLETGRNSTANMAYLANYKVFKNGHWHSIVQLTGNHNYSWSNPKDEQVSHWEWMVSSRVKVILNEMLEEGESAHVLTNINGAVFPKKKVAERLKSTPKVHLDDLPDFDPGNNRLAQDVTYKFNFFHRPKAQQMAQIYLYRKGKKIKNSGAPMKRLVLKRIDKGDEASVGWNEWFWGYESHRELSPFSPLVTTLKYRHVEIQSAIIEPESTSQDVPDLIPDIPMIDDSVNRY
ncbi:MAG: hypothetical protein ACR2PX_12325 [Endozoicomonas sp.]|uniref:hypothetical protein n=1 Tax=Endozoicomonas sp. TaxID=1892382 RepID=UPI003D9B0A51